MPTEIYLVKVGMTMTEGMVEQWFIPDGGEVKCAAAPQSRDCILFGRSRPTPPPDHP